MTRCRHCHEAITRTDGTVRVRWTHVVGGIWCLNSHNRAEPNRLIRLASWLQIMLWFAAVGTVGGLRIVAPYL